MSPKRRRKNAKRQKTPKGPTGKRYSAEFKAAAVKLCRDSDVALSHIAHQLGISSKALSLWVDQAEADEGRGRDGALTSAEKEELKRLRKENRELRMVAEILKKAQAFCAAKDL